MSESVESRNLQSLVLTGSPYERGVTHGEAYATEIEANLETYLATFDYHGAEESDVYEMAEEFTEIIEATNEEYFAEMEGVAEGSGLSIEDITVLNARYEVMYGAWHDEAEEMADGCTAFGARPETTDTGHTYIGQNWDWMPPLNIFVMDIRRDDKPNMVVMTEAGIVGGKIGVNEHGLGMLLNGLVTSRDGEDPIKTPYHVRFREVLNASRLDQAIAPLITEDRACSANILLGHAEGELIDLELGPKATNYLYPADDHLLTHANHLEDDSKMESQFEKIVPDSLCRAPRLRRLLKRGGDDLSIGTIQDAFRDHFGRPASICGHPDTSKDELDQTQTNGSFVMDLNERRLLGTDGPPCENEYIEFQVSE